MNVVKTLIGAASVAGLLWMAGCESQDTGWKPARNTDFHYHDSSNPITPSAKPVAAKPRSGPCQWPTVHDTAHVWSEMAYPTGDANTSVVGLEKGFPTEVRRNEPFEYRVIVTNLTGMTLEDVVVTDTPGPNMEINSATPSGDMNQGAATWVIGTMEPCQSETFVVNATATADGVVGTCATVSYNSLLCATVPVVSPNLELVKTGPAEAMRCDAITYTFVVSNTGTGSIDGVVITDNLVSGLRGADGGNTITFDAGTLAAGQSKEFTATVSADRAGEFTNNATANSAGGLTAESAEVTTIVTEPSLEIEMECVGEQFANRDITYDITVGNSGDGDCSGTLVEATIPAGSAFVSATAGGVAEGSRVVWSLGGLAADADREVSFTVRPAAPGSFASQATVSCACAESATDSCETVASGIPAILLEVVDVNDPVRVGDQTTYQITVTNQGSAPGTNIELVFNLEASMEAVSYTGATAGTANGRTITFAPIPTLAPKAQATFTVTVRALAAGDTRFHATMTSDQLTRPVEETEATNLYE